MNFHRRPKYAIDCAVFAALACTFTANAQLNGNRLTAEWRWPEFDTVLESHLVVVSTKVELPADIIQRSSSFDIDIGDRWVEFRFHREAEFGETDFNGWYFEDLDDTIPDFTGYSIHSYSNGIGGIGNIVTGFAANSFWADLGGMKAFGRGEWIRFEVSAGYCLELTVSTLTAGQTATWDVSKAAPSAEVAIVYGFSPGLTAINGFAGYCANFGIKGINQQRLVCRKKSDFAGKISCRKTLAGNIGGRRVLSQAAERGTCPDTCMSNVDDQIIQ